MNASTVFRFGWKAFLICAVIVAVASVNTPRAGRAYDPKTSLTSRNAPVRKRRTGDGISARSTPQRSNPGRDRPAAGVRGLRGNQPFQASTGTIAAVGDTPCTLAGNCQARDDSDALRSNRTEFNAADDFRPSVSENITEACWWGTYGDDTSGSLVNCHEASVVDKFEITYCNDEGGVPGTTCTTFSQELRELTVTGPIATGDLIAGTLTEFAFSATHAPFAVSAGQCYWIEITNDSGTCTWFWEVSTEGGDWAMLDGDGVTSPDGIFDLDEFVLLDFAFCLDVGLSADSPCGPPSNDACPGATSCCEEAPLGVAGCDDDLCCRRVCACDPLCCDASVGWDMFCATTGVNENGCGAEILCVQDCSPCGDPDTGDCCVNNGSAACSDATCCQAVCAVDVFCCEDMWDDICASEAETICPQLCDPPICGNPDLPSCCEANPLVAGCSDAACCEAVCELDPACCTSNIGWDNDCATLGFGNTDFGAQLVCPELCGCTNFCGDINGDTAGVNGPASNADLLDYALFANCFGLVPSDSPECLCSDLNADGVIDATDFQLLVALFESASTNIRGNCAAP